MRHGVKEVNILPLLLVSMTFLNVFNFINYKNFKNIVTDRVLLLIDVNNFFPILRISYYISDIMTKYYERKSIQ